MGTGNGHLTRVDPRDALARPDLWKLVNQTSIVVKRPQTIQPNADAAVKIEIPSTVHGVNALAGQLWNAHVPMPLEQMIAIKPAAVKPDVGALARLTGQGD